MTLLGGKYGAANVTYFRLLPTAKVGTWFRRFWICPVSYSCYSLSVSTFFYTRRNWNCPSSIQLGLAEFLAYVWQKACGLNFRIIFKLLC